MWRINLSNALTTTKLIAIANKLDDALHEERYAGWDPFDALNSQLFNMTPLRHVPVARLALTQLFKRSPYNLRKFAGVPKSVNPVTIALATEVARREGRSADASQLANWLVDMRIRDDGDGLQAWGYPFPWQAKAFYVAKNTPNIIATAYAVRELMNWRNNPAVPGAGDAILTAAKLVAARFSVTTEDNRRFIAYVPQSPAMVHNASLWGAYVLTAGVALGGPEPWLKLAEDAVSYSLAAQKEDGSWAYGEAKHHQFIDSFHTGYVLEALHRISRIAPHINVAEALARGTAFYLDNMFEADGTAKYYSRSTWPIDANPAAQAVITFNELGLSDAGERSREIMAAAVRNLWLEDQGHFAYQKSARKVIAINYPRWTQIWLRVALSLLLERPADSLPVARQQQAAHA